MTVSPNFVWRTLPRALISLLLLQCIPLPSPRQKSSYGSNSYPLLNFQPLSVQFVEARQAQCKLQAPSNFEASPADPFPSSNPNGQNTTNGGSGNGTIIETSFTYGVDKIRGVNLCVSITQRSCFDCESGRNYSRWYFRHGEAQGREDAKK